VTRPSVDVVIATRGDRPELLAEAVDSVLSQDYDGPLCLRIVYDSVEPPQAPLTESQEWWRQVSWTWNDGPHGLARARNVGAGAGEHALLAFLDDDDLWEPGKLSAQVELLEAEPTLPLVGTGITIVDDEGRRTPRPAARGRITHEELLRSRVAELHPSSFVMRRQAFLSVGGVDETLPGSYAEDYDLVLRLSRTADIGMVQAPLTTVRWTGGSYFFSRWQTIAEALETLLAKHPDLARHPQGSARITGQIAFARAAMGQRNLAWRALGRAARANARELRIPLAGLVILGVPANGLQSTLHRFGRGI
jgi:GT2 family glycosyltransferase